MTQGISPQLAKANLRTEYLFYRNSLQDWTDYDLAGLGAGQSYARLNHNMPEPFHSIGLGVPGIRVDNEAHYFDLPAQAQSCFAEDEPFVLEWAGVLGQPRSEFSADGAIFYNPMTLIGDNVAQDPRYINFEYPGTIAVCLGTRITSVAPVTYHVWYPNQPIHLVVQRSPVVAGVSDVHVYVNGCWIEMTGNDAGPNGFDDDDPKLFNLAAGSAQACFGVHYLFRGYPADLTYGGWSINRTRHVAQCLYDRVRHAFPTLRWPIPEYRVDS